MQIPRILLCLFLLAAICRYSLAADTPSTVMSNNESTAYRSCMAYAEAQEIYHRTDYNKNGVLEYAQALSGADSLLETAPGKGDLALIDKSFAESEAAPGKSSLKSGYLYKILKAQGPDGSGGKRNYIVNGNMVNGYALVAFPARYGKDTRRTFMISNAGIVYWKYLGEKTAESAEQMVEFNPDQTWKVADTLGSAAPPLPLALRYAHAVEKSPFDNAMADLVLNPQDAYLQYVALQLARRDQTIEIGDAQVAQVVQLSFSQNQRGADRRQSVDLFSLFSGALAVQECLQLEAMRGERARTAAGRFSRTQTPATEDNNPKEVGVETLKGPEVKSHPWSEMLAGRKPQISPLAMLVPEDFYYAGFRSLNNLIDAMEVSDLWGTHLFNQAIHEARTQDTGTRIKQQLVLETNPLLRPIYDMVVEEVAVVGSDLYLREGSDVTLIFKLKQPEIFKARMSGFITNAAKAWPTSKRVSSRYMDVDYEQLTTPERELSVYAAYPSVDIHVRSNSLAALQRIIDTIRSKESAGKPLRRLGDTDEFAYVRTLMPGGDKNEDGFIYLSDPFIHKVVSPALKLTEKRRILCYNHLRMIGHASLMYRTEKGKPPVSLEELASEKCSPGLFGADDLACPDGGKYTLSADGSFGVCSRHGHAHYLVPCCEIPVTKVTRQEAGEYDAFVQEYNQYWRTFFDPIALRVQITPQCYRLETLILPLIDNSVYTQLSKILGGNPEALDAAPVPKRNIFSVALKINKESLLTDQKGLSRMFFMLRDLKQYEYQADLPITDFLMKGIGNQVALHVCDAVPMFDFNFASFLGQALGSFNGGGSMWGSEILWVSVLVSALNAPVYVSIPVQDCKIVDDFLNKSDSFLAAAARRKERGGFIAIDSDFYKLQDPPTAATENLAALVNRPVVRSYGFGFGPVKWRFFWSRIGNYLYVASQPGILDDLFNAEAARNTGSTAVVVDSGPQAHAMVRVRPENWKQVLPNYCLGWAENNRQACLNNLSMLTSVARAYAASQNGTGMPVKSSEEMGRIVHKQADRLYAAHFFCPEGGRYLTATDGKSVICGAHGSVLEPLQGRAPGDASSANGVLRNLSGTSVSLTFLEDGLHAVLTIDRK